MISPSQVARAGAGGYTLLELLACLVIAGVLFAVSAPRYTAWSDRLAAREAASELSGTLSLARETAVARAAFVVVVLDSARGSAAVQAAGTVIARHDLSPRYGIRISANRDSVVYDSRGLGYGASNATIVVRRGAAAETVTVSRMGRVRW